MLINRVDRLAPQDTKRLKRGANPDSGRSEESFEESLLETDTVVELSVEAVGATSKDRGERKRNLAEEKSHKKTDDEPTPEAEAESNQKGPHLDIKA